MKSKEDRELPHRLARNQYHGYGRPCCRQLSIVWRQEFGSVLGGVEEGIYERLTLASSALNEMLMDKLTNSKILADDVRDLKKTPSDLMVFEDIAKMITNKIEERAVTERTKMQRADHTKQLLDQLNGNKPKDGKKVAASAAADDEKRRTPARLC